jgi:hypothetical protein
MYYAEAPEGVKMTGVGFYENTKELKKDLIFIFVS